ncbi:unnamed protein product [Ilex paraguariensis]|uniref:Ubiquitin-like domain-containing protein n=1 Tax=Ilex paraguariensis TaxID=185542 RepID=A0ABC8RYD1_9AQUA
MGKYGINVPRGVAVTSVEEVKKAIKDVLPKENELVVKSQILAGGRGLGTFKSGLKGGVHIVKADQVEEIAGKMLGQILVTKQTGPQGKIVSKVYLCEKLSLVNEMYFAITLDRTTSGPVVPFWGNCLKYILPLKFCVQMTNISIIFFFFLPLQLNFLFKHCKFVLCLLSPIAKYNAEEDCKTMSDSDPDYDYDYDDSDSDSIVNIRICIPSKNKAISLQPQSFTTIKFLKLLISKAGIPPSSQVLLYNGVELDDHMCLRRFNTEGGAAILHLLVHPPGDFLPPHDIGISIVAMLPQHRCLPIEVRPWYTVKDVKAVIESGTGKPLEQAKLKFQGRILKDSITMGDCDFNMDRILHVVSMPPPPPLPLPPFSGRDYSSIDTNYGEEFIITVREREFLWQIPFQVTTSNTVYEIKKKMGLKAIRQTLFLRRKPLRDEDTLGLHGIQENSVLWLWGRSLELQIKMVQCGTIISITLYSTETIYDLKSLIFENTGIPLISQTLVHEGLSLMDSLTLEDYNIQSNSRVFAISGLDCEDEEEIDLHITTNFTDPFVIRVKPWYKILDVKAVIESRTPEIPISSQKLYYNHERLKDWKTVADYNITDKSLIFVEMTPLPVHIFINTCHRSSGNNTIEIEAMNFTTVNELVDRIPDQEIENIKWHPCLFLDDVMLQGRKKLVEYGIVSGSVLSLDRLIQINMMDSSGKCSQVNLKPSYSVHAVKMKIQKSYGIPHDFQVLKYNKDEIDDRWSLEDIEVVLRIRLVDLRWNCFGRSSSFFWPSYVDDAHVF